MSKDSSIHQYETVARTVRKVLWPRTKDVHLIEDVCQNVMVICWKNERDLQDLPSERFERFVVRVALNQYCSWMRKRKLLNVPEGFEQGSSADDPARTTEQREQSTFLLSMLNGLPPHYREIARLHIVEGWTHERIASEKGVSINTIKTQFRRARVLLEEAVQKYLLN
jgi:RNA polymerase sigma-70 factor (ECF subfamily)